MTLLDTHTDATAAKASKTLGFLGRNLGECTSDVEADYTTLVKPTSENASQTWYHSSKTLPSWRRSKNKPIALFTTTTTTERQVASPRRSQTLDGNYKEKSGQVDDIV